MDLNVIYNEDCYTGIKKIPNKSIDLVYIDIPYEISYSGGGSLRNKISTALKSQLNNVDNLTNGIDYSIFDELCRIMKHIYIYMVQ